MRARKVRWMRVIADPEAGICRRRYSGRRIGGVVVDLGEEEGRLIVRRLWRGIGCLEGREAFGVGLCGLDLGVVGHGDLDRRRRDILDYLVEEGIRDRGLAWGYLGLKWGKVLGYPDRHDCPCQRIAVVEAL